jgi:hypothetical protein
VPERPAARGNDRKSVDGDSVTDLEPLPVAASASGTDDCNVEPSLFEGETLGPDSCIGWDGHVLHEKENVRTTAGRREAQAAHLATSASLGTGLLYACGENLIASA